MNSECHQWRCDTTNYLKFTCSHKLTIAARQTTVFASFSETIFFRTYFRIYFLNYWKADRYFSKYSRNSEWGLKREHLQYKRSRWTINFRMFVKVKRFPIWDTSFITIDFSSFVFKETDAFRSSEVDTRTFIAAHFFFFSLFFILTHPNWIFSRQNSAISHHYIYCSSLVFPKRIIQKSYSLKDQFENRRVIKEHQTK